jgi:hypothetical protein
MRTIVKTLVASAFAVSIAAQAGSQTQRLSIEQLGPEPFLGAPESLQKLVELAPAAVVAEIVSMGPLKLEEVDVPHSAKRTVRGYATYVVSILEVLSNNAGADAAPLVAGARLEVTQNVAREGAEAFVARRIPVAPGDECLLFLERQPNRWGILRWHMQFRKTKDMPPRAVNLGQGPVTEFIRPEWLGGVASERIGNRVEPDWQSLVAEVRRSAPAQTKR